MICSSQPSSKYLSRLSLSALAAFIILAIFLIPAALAGQGTITGSVVNIRSGPGSNHEITGTLLQDTKVEILQSSGDWTKIKYSHIEGWVASQYIGTNSLAAATPVNSSQTNAKPGTVSSRQVQVVNGPINSRSGPDASYDKMESLPDQAVYNVLGKTGDWYQIQLSNGQSAYVAGWLVKEIASTSPAPAAPAPVTPTPAAPATHTSNNAPSVIFNQQAMQFEVPPRIENGRTLVPLRAIFEAMGANVDWNESTRTVTAQRGGTTVVLPLGSTSPTVNGQPWQLEVPAKIVNSRTLAPLRFVGEALGGQVNWDSKTRIITIAYTPSAIPAAVIAKDNQVNLREMPSTSANKVDVASAGERMTVLSEQNGWYQVSRGGRTAWIASWVVEAVEAAKPDPIPAEPEPPVVVNPTPQPPTLPEPEVNDPENVLRLSRSRDDKGIKVIISSKLKMEPQIKENSGSIQYQFTDRPLLGLNYFEEKMGSELLKVKAGNYEKDTLITVALPSDVEYKMTVEEDGKQLIFFIPNYITNIEKSSFGSVGERLIVSTLCPVTPKGQLNGGKLEVTLPNLTLKKASNYSYTSDLVNSMKVEKSSSNTDEVLITFDTREMYKYNFATSGGNSDLNIILMRKTITEPREKMVVLDAGHGGRDTGARGTLFNEKDVNLAVTLKAGELLKQKGIRVEYTRTDDSFVELDEISNIANRLNAALFVSVHCNSTTSAGPSGTESYFYAPLSTPELFVQRDERQKLATLLQTELMSKLQRIDRGVKEKNLSVLRKAKMPSALVELAFLSNPSDQTLLMQDDFRNLAAQAIANAVEQYLNSNTNN